MLPTLKKIIVIALILPHYDCYVKTATLSSESFQEDLKTGLPQRRTLSKKLLLAMRPGIKQATKQLVRSLTKLAIDQNSPRRDQSKAEDALETLASVIAASLVIEGYSYYKEKVSQSRNSKSIPKLLAIEIVKTLVRSKFFLGNISSVPSTVMHSANIASYIAMFLRNEAYTDPAHMHQHFNLKIGLEYLALKFLAYDYLPRVLPTLWNRCRKNSWESFSREYETRSRVITFALPFVVWSIMQPIARKLTNEMVDCLTHPFIYCKNNFHEVEQGALYRSNQLSLLNLEKCVNQYGINTVINLRNEKFDEGASQDECYLLSELGARYVNIPLGFFTIPSPNDLKKIFYVFDQLKPPFLVHCKTGAAKSGVVSALWMIEKMGKPYSEAIDQISFKYGSIKYLYPHFLKFIKLWGVLREYLSRKEALEVYEELFEKSIAE